MNNLVIIELVKSLEKGGRTRRYDRSVSAFNEGHLYIMVSNTFKFDVSKI
jgi:hypothetical protein